MNIGDASKETGLPVKTIRYYEDIGLVTPARAENGYREFRPAEVDRLRLLSQARHLGFSLEECRKLVGFYADEHRTSREVREVAMGHLEQVRRKIEELRALEVTLEGMVNACRGDDDPRCAILEGLQELPACHAGKH